MIVWENVAPSASIDPPSDITYYNLAYTHNRKTFNITP